MNELKINPRFRDVIPPLDSEEYENLRESIASEGCRDAIIIWNGFIVDGHNRYRACQEFGVPFRTLEKEFEDEDAAIEWVMRNQLSRRNLFDVDRGRLALQLKEVIAARALKNCCLGGGDKKSEAAKSGCPNLDNPIEKVDTKKELAKIAGLSHGTLNKIERVDNEAPAPIREAMGKTISIDKAARFNTVLKQTPEAEREDEAKKLLKAEYDERYAKIKREGKIIKIIHEIVAVADMNYEYITDDCVDLYLKESPVSVADVAKGIDREIMWLHKIKEIFLRRGRELEGGKYNNGV